MPPPQLANLLLNLRAVRDAGVTIAMGTDAGNIGTLPGPSIYREFAQMARAGLTPREVLASATINGARLLGRPNELGLIARGRLADMVVLDADPLADVAHLSRIAMVVKGGRAFRQDELVSASPEDVVQRQVNAYNARDLDAFLATYHPDVRIYTFPDTLQMEGHAAMREVYGRMFAELPDLHAHIPRRIVTGNHVVDEEIVTGLRGGARATGTAIYELRDGRISRVWFIDGEAPAPRSRPRGRALGPARRFRSIRGPSSARELFGSRHAAGPGRGDVAISAAILAAGTAAEHLHAAIVPAPHDHVAKQQHLTVAQLDRQMSVGAHPHEGRRQGPASFGLGGRVPEPGGDRTLRHRLRGRCHGGSFRVPGARPGRIRARAWPSDPAALEPWALLSDPGSGCAWRFPEAKKCRRRAPRRRRASCGPSA